MNTQKPSILPKNWNIIDTMQKESLGSSPWLVAQRSCEFMHVWLNHSFKYIYIFTYVYISKHNIVYLSFFSSFIDAILNYDCM